jgi:hypothetical protein
MTDKQEFVAPELGLINDVAPKPQAMHADDHWMSKTWYEIPRGDPAIPEVHTYTNRMSYDPGDEVEFHSTATAPEWTLEIYRDGYRPETIYCVEAIKGVFSPTPKDAYRAGCGWPISHRWRLPDDTRSRFLPGSLAMRTFKRPQVRSTPFLCGPPYPEDAQGKNSPGAADGNVDRLQRFWRRLSLLWGCGRN